MAVQLPRYQQQVGVSAQSTGTQGSPQAASASWEAIGQGVARVGEQIVDSTSSYLEGLKEEKDKSDIANLDSMIALRSDEAKRTMATMDKPEEIAEFYDKWEKGVRDEYANYGLSDDARRAIDPQVTSIMTKNRIGANKIIANKNIEIADRSWIDMQSDSLDNKGRLNPETGVMMSPEEANAYAIDQRIRLGTIDYEKGQDEKRDFGQNLQYKSIVTIADNDVDEAERLLKESNLTDERLILATDAVRDARDRQRSLTETTQRRTANTINTELQNRRLSRQELDAYSKETVNIMGKEVPVVEQSVIDAYKAQLDASESSDLSVFRERTGLLNDMIKDLASAGSYDFGKKETEKVYKGIANLAKAGASKASVETYLNLADLATNDYAEGRGWNNGSVALIGDITDSLTTLYTDHPTRYKGIDPIGSIATKLDSFIQVVEEHKGKPSDEVIKKWRTENMADIDNATAVMNYSNTYRIGESKRIDNNLKVYRGDGVWDKESE